MACLQDDNVTNKMQPSFAYGSDSIEYQGDSVTAADERHATGTFQWQRFRLIGCGTVGSDATDSNAPNGLGVWAVTVEIIDEHAWITPGR